MPPSIASQVSSTRRPARCSDSKSRKNYTRNSSTAALRRSTSRTWTSAARSLRPSKPTSRRLCWTARPSRRSFNTCARISRHCSSSGGSACIVTRIWTSAATRKISCGPRPAISWCRTGNMCRRSIRWRNTPSLGRKKPSAGWKRSRYSPEAWPRRPSTAMPSKRATPSSATRWLIRP